MNELLVDPRTLCKAAANLQNMADIYGDVSGKLAPVPDAAVVFENGDMRTKWSYSLLTLLQYCADTRNNLSESARALIHYVNAVYEQDGISAGELQGLIDAYGDERTGTNPGLPPPDSGQVIGEPEFTPAEGPLDDAAFESPLAEAQGEPR